MVRSLETKTGGLEQILAPSVEKIAQNAERRIFKGEFKRKDVNGNPDDIEIGALVRTAISYRIIKATMAAAQGDANAQNELNILMGNMMSNDGLVRFLGRLEQEYRMEQSALVLEDKSNQSKVLADMQPTIDNLSDARVILMWESDRDLMLQANAKSDLNRRPQTTE